MESHQFAEETRDFAGRAADRAAETRTLRSRPTAAACAAGRRRRGARTRRPPARRSSSGCCGSPRRLPTMRTPSACGQLDEHDDVRALLGQRRVHRVPHPLVAVDDALGRRLLVAQVERVAPVAAPLRPPLPAVARVAALQQQPLVARGPPRTGRRGRRASARVRASPGRRYGVVSQRGLAAEDATS